MVERNYDTGRDFAMIAQRNAGEKPKEKTSGISGKNIVSQSSTVNFTECLETYLRVQNFGGNFQMGIIGRISQSSTVNCIRFGSLKSQE